MSRPKSKQELLESASVNYSKLLTLVDSFKPDNILFEFPEGYLNRNIKDVLAHLHAWHLMLIGWYEVGLKGEKPAMPAKGYPWKDLPDLNRNIHQKYRNEELETVQELLERSHRQVEGIIQSHTDQELFEKKKYKWTGSTCMAAYFISATSSHYDWAIKLIKKCYKNR